MHGALNNAIDQVNMLEDDTNTDDPAVTVRVLIQPGRRYVLREAVTIDEEVDSKISSVTIEAMEHYPEQFAVEAQDSSTAKKKRSSQGRRSGSDQQSLSPNRQSSSKRKRVSKSIMKIFKGCRTDDAIVTSSPTEEELSQADHHPEDDLDEEQRDHATIVADDGQSLNPTERNVSSVSNENGIVDIAELQKKPAPQATLVLRTRRHNEPLIRVRQGSCTIRNIKFKHMCSGTDIWNGNSAIQIQPPEEFGPNAHDEDASNADWNMPTVTLDRVNVTSSSGRGIVNIDGGTLTIVNSYIHDCAATGIYVGGPGSRATIERSDILNNGQGNTISRRGIPRGHSGVYLEQGHATIVDCNISQNSLTGISAISSQNAHLNLEDSELVSNGTFQLEMPAASDGTAASISAATSRSSSIARNNRFATEGRFGRSRSGLF